MEFNFKTGAKEGYPGEEDPMSCRVNGELVRSPVQLGKERAHMPMGENQVAIKQHLLTRVFKKRICWGISLGSKSPI